MSIGNGSGGYSQRVIAAYDYYDEQGQLLYQVQRKLFSNGSKAFIQRAWIDGQWREGKGALNGVRRVPYRLTSVLKAELNEPIFIVEGEKDADNLKDEMLVATTNSEGVKKWLPEFAQYFKGRHVCLLPDNDDVGRDHMARVADSLRGVAASITVIALPGLPEKGDVSDWLEASKDNDGQALVDLWGRERGKTGPGPTPEVKEPPPLELLFGEDAARAPAYPTTVVRGILHKGSITLIHGAPKSGKSFLATDLALAVADEERNEWMGHRIKQHGPVLYVACEGHGGYWKRLQATGEPVPPQFVLARGRPQLILSQDGGKGFSWAPNPKDILLAIARILMELGEEPVAVIIDTVFRSIGGGNVNNSADMNAYVAAAQEIADRGIAIALVHHTTKQGGSPAGSVALTGASDTLVGVKKDKDDGDRTWEVEEAKDDAETPPRAFRLEVVEGILDHEGDYVSSCKVVDAGIPEKKGSKKTEAKKEAEPLGPKPPKEPPPLRADAEKVRMALEGMFADPGVPKEERFMEGVSKVVPTVARSDLRDRLQNAGLLEEGNSSTVRMRLARWISTLVISRHIMVGLDRIALVTA